ncbi:MAG: hypothetical protein LUE23_12235 [Lachnospiraceae bacterium]|nr:hypothetical protein [Lachnospiraceae bacterium]
MSIIQLDFAEPFFSIDYIEEESSYQVGRKSMIINLAEHEHQNISLTGGRAILPLKAAMVQNMTIGNPVRAFVIRDVERTDIRNPATAAQIQKSWKSIYELSGIARHKGLPYYKSPKFCIGEGNQHMELNLCFVSEGMVPSGPHREHDRDFDEVHAQIAGYGMMRVYDYEDKEHIHQELNMAPGIVHDKMYDSEGRYPWHEYKSVTPCIYCPIELDRGNSGHYHPQDL